MQCCAHCTPDQRTDTGRTDTGRTDTGSISTESEVIVIKHKGLDSSRVRELTAQGKVNVQIDRTAKTTKDIIKENVFT